MAVGRYYMDKRDYTAAINRFKIVVTQYQTTRHVEEALARLTEAYMADQENCARARRRRFALADDADRHIGLGEPCQRFLDMPCGLVLRDHDLEAVDRGV